MENTIKHLQDIVGLYDEFIISDEPLASVAKEKEKNKKTPNYLGSNKNGIAMIYHSLSGLAASDQLMLDNLVRNALKFNPDEMVILNMAENTDWTLTEMVEALKVNRVIVWGLNLISADYTIIQVGNARLIAVNELSSYHEDITLKRKLWEAIKPLFDTV